MLDLPVAIDQFAAVAWPLPVSATLPGSVAAPEVEVAVQGEAAGMADCGQVG